MVAPEDFLLTKEEMRAKYAGKGSPDYPTHAASCGCSGCHASWCEWRGAFAGVEALRGRLRSVVDKLLVIRGALVLARCEDADRAAGDALAELRALGVRGGQSGE